MPITVRSDLFWLLQVTLTRSEQTDAHFAISGMVRDTAWFE